MKRFTLVIVLLLAALVLCSCSTTTTENTTLEVGMALKAVGRAVIMTDYGHKEYADIVVDTSSRAMYFFDHNGSQGEAMSPCMNPDGSLQTYDDDKTVSLILKKVGRAVITDPYGHNEYTYIVADTSNKVMYFYAHNGSQGETMSPCMNPDGSLKLYEGELD